MSRKKLLLVGFIIVILIAIPVTIFLVKQQQETRSQAEQATTLSFEPASTLQTPLQAEKDDIVDLDLVVDPGANQNLVSFVKVEILYDPTKLATVAATPQEPQRKSFAEETSVMSLLEGPVYSEGKIVATLSVGVDPTKVIQTKTKIATLKFAAIDGTGSTPTEVSFSEGGTQVLSAGENDQANENVLAGTDSAFIAIAGEATTTTSPSPSLTVSPSVTVTPTTPVLSTTPSQTATTSPTPTIIGDAIENTPPVCTAFNVDRTTTGPAPFSITFTAVGTDSNGTISKVTFSYGDGQVDNVTQGGGIGTASVNASAAHTYQNAGTYTASAVLTDNNGGISSGTCTQTITVDTALASGDGGGTTTTTSDASLPATGPGDVILGIGGILGVLSIIGGIIFFAL